MKNDITNITRIRSIFQMITGQLSLKVYVSVPHRLERYNTEIEFRLIKKGIPIFLIIILVSSFMLTVSAFVTRRTLMFLLAGLSWLCFGVYEIGVNPSTWIWGPLFGAMGLIMSLICFGYTLGVSSWIRKENAGKYPDR